jgi:hypothetical protein
MDISQIVFEEDIQFDNEDEYNNFITYCNWYIFGGEDEMIKDISHEDCSIFKDLCYLFIEPNMSLRMSNKYYSIE